MTSRSVSIVDRANNKTVELPIMSGTLGTDVIDIRALYKELGYFTFDPGYTATGSCQSKVTYIDGDEGVLLYRGYPIEQLAEHSDYMETCYLILFGELPDAEQKANSYTTSRITRCCTTRSPTSIGVSGATRTRWR